MGKSLAQLRLIAAAILFGAFTFMVIVPILLAQAEGKGFAGEPVPLLEWIAAGVGLIMAGLAFAVRALILRRAEGEDQATRGAAMAQATIASLSLLEGGMLFNCVVWLLNATTVPNAVVATLLFLLSLLIFPRSENV